MTDNNKLIEILDKSFAEQHEKRGLLTAQHTADDLLANGVIVPPCYIGQEIWYLCEHYDGSVEIKKGKISMLQQKADKSWKFRFSVNSSVWDFKIDDIGVIYFLTQEEAEEKLKELNK